mgnify:CR=1 FL=1
MITGGAGFIGANLGEYLIKNNRVICLDNFSTGKKSNIAHLLDSPNSNSAEQFYITRTKKIQPRW